MKSPRQLYLFSISIALSLHCAAAPSSSAGQRKALHGVHEVILPMTDLTMRSYPAMTQSPLPTCYAHTAAQLLELELKKRNALPKDFHIDPVWLATSHKEYRNQHPLKLAVKKNHLDRSAISWAIHDSLKTGFCSSQTVHASLDPFQAGRGSQLTHEEIVGIMMEAFQAVKKGVPMLEALRKSSRFFHWLDDLEVTIAMQRLFTPEEIKILEPIPDQDYTAAVIEQFFKSYGQTLELIENTIRITPQKNIIAFLDSEVFSSCKDHPFFSEVNPKLKHFSLGFVGKGVIKEKMCSLLNAKNPKYLAIGYCMDYLEKVYEPKKRTLAHQTLPRMFRHTEEKCGAHYAMLVGKRQSKANQTEFLLMNTHNPYEYSETSDGCLCRNEITQAVSECRKAPTIESHLTVQSCWFNADQVVKNMYDAVYFE